MNEGAVINRVVRNARNALRRFGYTGEIIVVDGGSSDRSIQQARRAGARTVYQPIPGYGAACIRGLTVARGRIMVLVDGDGTYDLSEINRFVEPLLAGYDVVYGTRRNGDMRPRSMSFWHRQFWEPLQTFIARRFFRTAVSDVRCGIRAITREALARIRLTATGMEFATEFMVQASLARLKSVEVPVRFYPRTSGPSRRTALDAGRVITQLLLLSPTHLFLLPGLFFLALGLGLEAVLLPGRLRVGHFGIDYHFMFVGGALAIFGFQLILLGLYAKTWALLEFPEYADPWIRRFHLRYSLSHVLGAGVGLFAVGFIIDAWILAQWILDGMGDLFAVRPAMIALTVMILGMETVFAAFFLSLLRSRAFGRVK